MEQIYWHQLIKAICTSCFLCFICFYEIMNVSYFSQIIQDIQWPILVIFLWCYMDIFKLDLFFVLCNCILFHFHFWKAYCLFHCVHVCIRYFISKNWYFTNKMKIFMLGIEKNALLIFKTVYLILSTLEVVSVVAFKWIFYKCK